MKTLCVRVWGTELRHALELSDRFSQLQTQCTPTPRTLVFEWHQGNPVSALTPSHFPPPSHHGNAPLSLRLTTLMRWRTSSGVTSDVRPAHNVTRPPHAGHQGPDVRCQCTELHRWAGHFHPGPCPAECQWCQTGPRVNWLDAGLETPQPITSQPASARTNQGCGCRGWRDAASWSGRTAGDSCLASGV